MLTIETLKDAIELINMGAAEGEDEVVRAGLERLRRDALVALAEGGHTRPAIEAGLWTE